MISYERSTGYVCIEWWEKKKDTSSPIRHYYEKRPVKLQLHPRDPKLVVRAYFADKMPGWMNNFCKKEEHPFEAREVFNKGDVGWWIANWRVYKDGYKPMTAPNLDGSIQQFVNLIPEACDEKWKQTLLMNRDNIKFNLHHYPDLFQPYGLYYRPEEIGGEGGCLLIEHDIIPNRMSEESDDDYKHRVETHGKLERLIFELTTRLPEPIPDEEETMEENAAEEITADTESEPDEEFGFGSEEEGFGFDRDDAFEFEEEEAFGFDEEEGGLEGSEEFLEGSASVDNEEASFGFEEQEDVTDVEPPFAAEQGAAEREFPVEQSEETNKGENEPLSIEEPELDASTDPVEDGQGPLVAAKSPIPDPVPPADEEEEELPTQQFKVVDFSDKKAGVFAGQLSLF